MSGDRNPADRVVLRSHRVHGTRALNPAPIIGSLPLALFIAVSVARAGLTTGLLAVLAGFLVALLVMLWFLLRWVILLPEGVRVHNGLRSHLFRPGPDLLAFRLRTTDGIVADEAGTLFLKQGHRRGVIGLPLRDQKLILERLDVEPFEAVSTRYGPGREVPAQYRATMPYWRRHMYLFALEAVAVLLAAIIIAAVLYVRHETQVYRRAAADRLTTAAAVFADQPGWRPEGSSHLAPENDTDSAALTWQRAYTVSFNDANGFTRAWAEISGPYPEPYCSFDALAGVHTHCVSNAQLTLNGVKVEAEVDFYGTDLGPSTLRVTLIDLDRRQ